MSPRFKDSSQLHRRLGNAESPISDAKALLWIICLAFVSVGARNFEDGLSLDAPLYASIARNIARTGEWFFMYGNVPDFVPFAEHTHFGFWLQALIFKVLPAADWSVRILGHLSYVINLFLVFKIAKYFFNQTTAVISVLLLWSWAVFSNFHSTFYLDGPTLSFGLGFLYFYYKALYSQKKKTMGYAALAGTLLGLAALTKGLTFLVFGPTAAAIFLSTIDFKRPNKSKILKHLGLSGLTLAALGICLALYYAAIKNSSVPNFLEIYHQRQFENRFQQAWNWSMLWDFGFWKRLARDTHWLTLFLPLALFRVRKHPPTWIIFTFFATGLMMYAPASRIGGQYWLILMPPLAILLSGAFSTSKWGSNISPAKWTKNTQIIAVAIVLLIQYLPFRTHVSRYPDVTPFTDELKKAGSINHLLVSGPSKALTFITLSPFGWYPDLPVNYLKEELLRGYNTSAPIPLEEQSPKNLFRLPGPRSAIFHFVDPSHRTDGLAEQINEFEALTPDGTKISYCLIQRIGNSTLFVPKTSTKPYSCVK
ncbi:hypothetical protein GW916_15245 [bacterium]|nr:hypothetical protein [bacterium]